MLDLLGPGESAAVVAEARRLLRPGGLLAVVSLTHGVTWPGRAHDSRHRLQAGTGQPEHQHHQRRFDVLVANLVGNAVHHGQAPVTVRAHIGPGGDGARELTVQVRDHGPGLPPNSIAHVFERFYKADTARARSEGSGLGLAIAWETRACTAAASTRANHLAAARYSR